MRALVWLSLLGGAAAQCTQPVTTGYDLSGVVETTLAQGLTFDVSGVVCETGYTQSVGELHVQASTCLSDNTPYELTGCGMCDVNYVWDGSACTPCPEGSTSEGPFGTPAMVASGAAASCTENTCAALSDEEWAARGCTVTDATATTVTGLGALGADVAGFTGTCSVTCANNAFAVSGVTACTPLEECAGATSCTTDADTGRTCDDCNAGYFPDDANNQCSPCTPIAECTGTTDCTTSATSDQSCDSCSTGYSPPDCTENVCQTWAEEEWAVLGCMVGDVAGTTVSAVGACTVLAGFFGSGTVKCDTAGDRFTVTGLGACTPLEHCTGTTSCTTDEVTGRTCDTCATGYVPDDANNRCAPEHALDTSLPTGFTGTMSCTALHDASTCSGVSCAAGYSTSTLRLVPGALTTLPLAGTGVSVAECCEDNTGMCTNNRYGIGDFICPVGYVPKTDANGHLIGAGIQSDSNLDAGRRTTACCDRVFCAESDCPATKVLLPNALTTLPPAGVAVSEAACCEDRAGMCSSNAISDDDFSCPVGYAAKAESEDIASVASDPDAARTAACCDRVFCTEEFCRINPTKTLRPNAAFSLPEAGVEASTLLCCEDRAGMCTGNALSSHDYTCPAGYRAKSDAVSIASPDSDSDADRTAACCDRKFCTAGLCSLYPGRVLIPNAETTLPEPGAGNPSNLLCCENRVGRCGLNFGNSGNFVCPTGYTEKPNFEDIESPASGDDATRTAECCDRVFCDESVCKNGDDEITYHDADTHSSLAAGDEIVVTGCTLSSGHCDPLGHCVATDPDNAADVSICDAVANDGNPLTCTGATGTTSGCTFTVADPSTSSSTYTLSMLGADNELGDTMAGTCTAGHVGSPVATCGANGQWTVTTECDKIPDFCTNDPDTGASLFDVPTVATDNEVGDTITGTARDGFEGAATATCTALSSTSGAWVVTTSSTVIANFCGNSASLDSAASTFTLPTAPQENELFDTVTGVCADGYEGFAFAVCAASGNFEIFEQCTACPIGKSGIGGTCSTCAGESCSPSDPLGSCVATDPDNAADVSICDAVANDGNPLTCTGAAGTTSGCTFTVADPACADVELDGVAETCTNAGACTYSPATFTVDTAQTSCTDCTACSAGEATLTECRANADRTCQPAAGFSDAGACDVEACAAIDANDASDVAICSAVVLDGHADTCTDAQTNSGCAYTPGTFSRFNGAATCTGCTECDVVTEETATACTTTSDRTCRKVTAYRPGAQASAAITGRLGSRSTDTSTQSSTKRASTRTTLAMDRARVFAKSNALESDHAKKLAGMRAKRSSMQIEIDAKVTERMQTADELESAHAALLQETNTALQSARGRVDAAMAAKTAEATRVSELRASQLEQHNADTALLAGQRDMFAKAAAAQQVELASTQGAGIPGVAQEVLDAENYITTSQANAGYSELLGTPGGAGRRLLGEL